MTIEFQVPGLPIAQPRVKARAVQVGMGRAHARVYTPKVADSWKAMVAFMCKDAMNGPPLEGAVWLYLSFGFPRPALHFGTGRNKGKQKASAPPYHTKKPDLDNLVKAVKDAINGIAWKDDAQVVTIIASKGWDNEPGVWVGIDAKDRKET